jgi:hypothetical protein
VTCTLASPIETLNEFLPSTKLSIAFGHLATADNEVNLSIG